jgi:multidrug efflux pump subunit AcrB
MKLKTKLYIAAALFFMLLGHFVGRIMTLFGIVIVIGFVVVLAWPVIKRFLPNRKRV